ncbi:MAG TPA: autotransporter outer membrane beta-barrel domain-containing protein [Steroidobacteraceae bacterium]|nr:autotransporter outer membrane beta-barrel domain-containing protein [Steroidobacteraceae bacterium]
MLSCLGGPAASAATPDFAVAVRAGTPGAGLDLDLGLSPSFGVRVGFAGFNFNHTIDTSDVDYDGRLKLRTVTGLLDWYVFRGGFHLTAGVAGNGTKLDVVGQPSQGSYTINGTTYSSSQLGSLTGELKFGNSLSPYVGLGWGNPAGESSRVHWLLDVGAIYGGTPSVSLTAQCGPAAPAGSALCQQIQGNVASEEQKLRDKADILRWYPVVNLGVAVRF